MWRHPFAPSSFSASEETPALHGFVDLGGEAPVQAALFYHGETTLVAVGDGLGEYPEADLDPPAAVALTRPGRPPLRLALHPR